MAKMTLALILLSAMVLSACLMAPAPRGDDQLGRSPWVTAQIVDAASGIELSDVEVIVVPESSVLPRGVLRKGFWGEDDETVNSLFAKKMTTDKHGFVRLPSNWEQVKIKFGDVIYYHQFERRHSGNGLYKIEVPSMHRISVKAQTDDGDPVTNCPIGIVLDAGDYEISRLLGVTDSDGWLTVDVPIKAWESEGMKSGNICVMNLLNSRTGQTLPRADGWTVLEPITLGNWTTLVVNVIPPANAPKNLAVFLWASSKFAGEYRRLSLGSLRNQFRILGVEPGALIDIRLATWGASYEGISSFSVPLDAPESISIQIPLKPRPIPLSGCSGIPD